MVKSRKILGVLVSAVMVAAGIHTGSGRGLDGVEVGSHGYQRYTYWLLFHYFQTKCGQHNDVFMKTKHDENEA